MKNLIIKIDNKEMLLSKYVCNEFKNMPYSAFCKALRNKDIRINNVKISKDCIIKDKDNLTIYIKDEILYGYNENIDVIFEDDNIIAVYKPKGIISNNEESAIKLNEITFEDIVKKYNSNAKICHRLDRNTDGIIIFSKNDVAYNELLSGFKKGYINKNYIAYVHNSKFKVKHSVEEAYLFTNKKEAYSYISSTNKKGYERIITEYTVIYEDKINNYAKLDIKLHTGKTHQIRAHLKEIFHPVIGDSKYGLNEINRKFKKSKQCLTAYKYTFNFSDNLKLKYLNNIVIKLEDSKIKF